MNPPQMQPATAQQLDDLRALARGPGLWNLKLWPTCGEASLTFTKTPRVMTEIEQLRYDEWLATRPDQPEDDNEERALRRARGEMRRYERHNRCDQMVTFTFAGEPPAFDSLSDVMHNFWKRFTRATGTKIGPYVWVPEWGKVTGRLHIHMAIPWWRELNCVEVCPRCDKYGVLRRANALHPPDDRSVRGDRLCCGCLWGHGFVGRPRDDLGQVETNQDGRALSRYLSKYLAKDLGSELSAGQQRYRLAQGYQPTCIDEAADDLTEALHTAEAIVRTFGGLGTSPTPFVPVTRSDLHLPPIVLLDWLSRPITDPSLV